MSDQTVYVVDDDVAICHSIGFMLRQAGHRVETHAPGTAFLQDADQRQSGCVLLDVRMPGVDGLEVQARLAEQGSALPVIVLTGHSDVSLAVRAMKAGATEFLEKPFERSALLAIDHAFKVATRTGQSRLTKAEAEKRLAILTPREHDVLSWMVLGHPIKLIAFDLGIATRSVEVHRASLMEKLDARSLSDVLRIAFAAGLAAED